MSASASLLVLLGTPHSGIEAQAQRLADAAGAVFLGDLPLSLADDLQQLRDQFAIAQTPLHPPLFQALQKWMPESGDPDRFLAEHTHWSVAELLGALAGAAVKASRAPRILVSDLSAGFRIHQAESWLQRLPEASFVHVTTPLAAFVSAADAALRDKLYQPPDYRDHLYTNAVAPLKVELAWYQVHCTLLRAFADARSRRTGRIDLRELESLDLQALDARMTTGSSESAESSALHRTRMAPSDITSMAELAAALGY